MFSVIMQSYLGEYNKAASNRDEKIIRAIESVLNQTYKEFELIIVADGCQKTFDKVIERYYNQEKVECYLIKKQPMWTGFARNHGIERATGDLICYLDIDDYFGVNHLQIIKDNFEKDWVWFNDKVMNKKGELVERNIIINQRFQNGTSNICHKKSLPVKWNGSGYANDDWSIIQKLLPYPHVKIPTPEYNVCHLPGYVDA